MAVWPRPGRPTRTPVSPTGRAVLPAGRGLRRARCDPAGPRAARGPVDGLVVVEADDRFAPYRIVPGRRARTPADHGRPAWPCRPTRRPTGAACGRLTRPAHARCVRLVLGRDGIWMICRSMLPCDQPHPAELLATGWIRNRSMVPERTWKHHASISPAGSCTPRTPPELGRSDRRRPGSGLDGAAARTAPLSVDCFVTSAGPQQLAGHADRPRRSSDTVGRVSGVDG